MVRREFKQEMTLGETFFPVNKVPLFYRDSWGISRLVPNHYGIQNLDNGHLISVVSKDYRMITNEEAYYRAEDIVSEVFNDTHLQDMQLFNLRQTQTRSCMILDLISPGKGIVQSPDTYDKEDCWKAFLRITNSYNSRLTLSYELGFCRDICYNGMIFSPESVRMTFVHGRRLQDNLINLKGRIGKIRDLEKRMSSSLQQLSQLELSGEDMLPMFLKVFPLSFTVKDKNKDEIKKMVGKWSNVQVDNLMKMYAKVNNLIDSYKKEMGTTAYAMLNVLTDYASFPREEDKPTYLSGNFQRRAGAWMDDVSQYAKVHENKLTEFAKDKHEDAAFLRAFCEEMGERKKEKENSTCEKVM